MTASPLVTSSVNSANPSYRPDIDGLRAVAVLAVVLYHFRLAMPGGFIGVDVFFVISGYLITGVIAKHHGKGPILPFLAEFWVRRVRRLAPALTVVTGVTMVGCYAFLSNKDCIHLALGHPWLGRQPYRFALVLV
jgi:peptidoglycan/LPS O-acetylase OafA/YrhL